ncbi:hypothetical protein AXG93_3964s1090 [Marchantia polymorpha subsp. ruderalis]|uniref:Uncharacterized protein n=1 Tax=Marchantia polymorpha subsp. ruderalis TaxID=1480154 RepID=A0A176WDT9_MARPO|nr:hypothetical protein AXG93_3964s1090 [Marchantia polymorpha subsp. ruderalis]
MAPKKSDKVRKLVPLKVPYEELRSFRRDLSELRLEFLLWNWNCVSVGFFERILKGQRVHWTRIFYDLVWVNAGSRWTGSLINHITPFLVNFYRGMELLTREEEKRFPKKREILTAESSESTEDDTRQPSIPPQTTVRGPVQMDVVQRREK